MNSGIQGINWWRKSDSATDRVVDWLVILSGIVLGSAIYWITLRSLYLSFLWLILLWFYFFFYRRMAQAIYWSANTFYLLRKHQPSATKDGLNEVCRPEILPTFHILVAAYDAGVSIGPVMKAAACQDYPSEQYTIWIITEHSEQLKSDNQAKELTRRALNIDADSDRIGSLIPFFWRCQSQNVLSLEAWIKQVTTGPLRSYLNYSSVWSVLLEDLLSRLLHEDNCGIDVAGKLDGLQLSTREIQIIENELSNIEKRVMSLADDFARLLGSDKVCQPKDLESQLVCEVINKGALKRIGQRLCRYWADRRAIVAFPDVETVQRAAKLINSSTQEVIHQTIDELHPVNIRHLDPSNQGFKPGALNVAYRQIKAEGLIEEPDNVYFVIVDADSLLPAHALKAIAHELEHVALPAIMQMTSIPTANFFNGNWFTKFISFADAIGAVGKWARSTRRQLKPDLQAGSGVIVPASLSQFIEAQTGFAWDETTLTEDARLIIGQFGMMNGIRNKTRMAPVFLLEAVPSNDSFLRTYQSFWNQRRRWSAGGYDEFFYMLRCPRWIRHSRFNQATKHWEVYSPNFIERLRIRLRQFHRTGLWLWDHFIWGIGGFIVLTHWWLISVIFGAPSATIRAAGLLALLLTPFLFIVIPGRQLSWFVPGGLSVRRKCLLYIQSYLAIWFYCLPTVATQLICIFGFRSKIVEWKPTQKPRYQMGRPVNVAER